MKNRTLNRVFIWVALLAWCIIATKEVGTQKGKAEGFEKQCVFQEHIIDSLVTAGCPPLESPALRNY